MADKNKKTLWDSKLWCDGGTFYNIEKNTLSFDPPCYIQRYASVAAVISDEKQKGSIRKVVDFGCAEMVFFTHLKRIDGVMEVLEVDIDEDLLSARCNKVEPFLSDYLEKRRSPLNVKVLCGSVDECDSLLDGADIVVAIELIEHLYPETIARFPVNIFGRICPRVAIFTTPNAEFNVLFPGFTGMRHDDHKFEWSRRQFQAWAENIVQAYPTYSVRLYGIGPGPEGTSHLGCCTQMAVFRRLNDDSPRLKTKQEISRYKVIREVDFPFYEDNRTLEEKVMGEIRYQLQKRLIPDDSSVGIIPLRDFLPYVQEYCSSVESLSSIVKAAGWRLRGLDVEPFIVVEELREDQLNLSVNEPACEESDEDEPNKCISSEDCDWNKCKGCGYERDIFTEEYSFNGKCFTEQDSINKVMSDLYKDNRVNCLEEISIDKTDQCNEEVASIGCISVQSDAYSWCEAPANDLSYEDWDNIKENASLISMEVSNKIHSEIIHDLDSNELSCVLPSEQSSDHTVFTNGAKEAKLCALMSPKPGSSHCGNSQSTQPWQTLPEYPMDWSQPLRIESSGSEDWCNGNLLGPSAEGDKDRPLRNVIGYGRPRKILAKSASLDSCLENINCQRADMQAMYSSMHSRTRNNELGSPSERGPDSGYPASASLDLTDGTSDDSLSGDEPPVGPRVFIPAHPPVENGDVANNNRDGEGNNVEGIRNPLPEPIAAFPPWLLHLLLDPLPAQDEGLGDEDSDRSDSPAPSD